MITPSLPQTLQLSKTAKNWIVSAIAFASIDLLFELSAIPDAFQRGAVDPGLKIIVLKWILAASDIVISLTLIWSAMNTLRAGRSGIYVLKAASLAAAILVLFESLYIFLNFTSKIVRSSWIDLIVQALTVISRDQEAARDVTAQYFHVMLLVCAIGAVAVLICQFVYYLCLHQAVSKFASPNQEQLH